MRLARPRIGSRRERLAVMLAVAAMLLHSVIVPGLMPDLAAMSRGEFKLVICTSAGVTSIAVPGKTGAPPRQRSDGSICPYASPGHTGQPADALAAIAALLPPAFDAPEREASPPFVPIRAFAARAPPSIA